MARNAKDKGDTQPAYGAAEAKRALIALDIIFILGILCLQAFGYIFRQVGADLGALEQAPLITSIPGIILGIVCFIYGSLSDFVSLKKMTAVGVALLVIGSVMGFFLHSNILLVIVARCLQTAGGQVAGSVYLAIASRYLTGSEQVTFFGIFTASYQFATAVGVVSSGFLSTVDWSLLFLIPIISLLFVPMLAKSMPDADAAKTKVDVVGFTIFGIMITLLTLFFSYGWPFLVGAAAMLAVFVAYINRAKDPFIGPDFFRNLRWVRAILLIFIFYFINFSVTNIFNGVGTDTHGLSSSETSFYLISGSLMACIFGLSSGRVVEKIGRTPSIFLAGSLQCIGFLVSSLLIEAGMVPFTLGICLFYAGQGLMYSPITTMVLGTLSASQAGRGIGTNDLVMNVSGSIGITIFGSIMGTTALSGFSLIGAAGKTATYSNLLLTYAATMMLGIIAFACFRKAINPKER